jgi:hypothetical protein
VQGDDMLFFGRHAARSGLYVPWHSHGLSTKAILDTGLAIKIKTRGFVFVILPVCSVI